MRFGTGIVRSLYGAVSLKTVTRKLVNYKLDLVAVQEVRCRKGGSELAGDNANSMEMGMLIIT
jgi:hypothetical protein